DYGDVVEMLSAAEDLPRTLVGQYRRRGPYPTLIAVRDQQIEGILSGSSRIGRPLVSSYIDEAQSHGCTFVGGTLDYSSDPTGRRHCF
ncbi:hypothetical protein ACC848_40885, partial [Rhizobium johnstonii]